jgi:hypothetical protein
MRLSRPLAAALIGHLALIAIAAAPRGSARAADNTVAIPAGGLLLVHDDRIVIEAQELIIGRASIRATYAVRNRSAEPISRIVSWPLPDIDKNAIGEDVVVLAAPDPRNFAAAAIAVDGHSVPFGLEQRAWAFRRDVSELLQKVGLPLNPMAPDIEEKLSQLPAERLGEFEERGVIRRDPPRAIANWTVTTTAFWRQTFEPGKVVTIGLAYVPVTASGLWDGNSLANLRETYCIDKDLEGAIAARAAKAGRGLVTHKVTYSVRDEPGWWVPIPKFRLAIEKPSFEALIATCQKNLGIVGPTLLEWVGQAWRPDDDIKVLFID